jgi:catechol 2,3-dioxygenase-like lactoylglutathione lyase family enzyme
MRMTQVAPLIAVREVERSVRFYQQLGFEPAVQNMRYARLTVGDGGVLHLAAQGEAPPDRPSVAMTAPEPGHASVTSAVIVQVPDCAEACQELTARGVRLLSPASVPVWGGEVRAFVCDPDGHLVEINEQLA